MRPLLAALALLGGCASTPPPAALPEPMIIAHRGASGLRPEHTLAAYQLAIEEGAGFIESDLVMTRDGVLVARHENEISGTTDVADHPEFADRRTTRTIDGERVTGWFTEDFTLEELRTVRARERLPQLRPGNAEYDGQFPIPTLAEIIELAQSQDRPVGIVPEIKHPSYFRSIGLPMEEALADQLRAAGYSFAEDPVLIQSFEIGPLERLNRLTDLRLVQLVAAQGGPADRPGLDYADMIAPEGLVAIARYADVLGPDRSLVIPRTEEDRLGEPTSLIAEAHAAGLLVVPWTFRAENFFLPFEFRVGEDPRERGQDEYEMLAYLRAGIDGLFTDHPADGVYAAYLFVRPAIMRELGERGAE